MQLSITTDYALRILLCLCKKGTRKTACEISYEMSIPERYVLKVLRKLKENNIIIAFPGKQGGYELAKDLSEISLKDIVELTETTIKINRCLEDDEYCSRDAVSTCPVRKFYCGLQQQILKKTQSISVRDILEWA